MKILKFFEYADVVYPTKSNDRIFYQEDAFRAFGGIPLSYGTIFEGVTRYIPNPIWAIRLWFICTFKMQDNDIALIKVKERFLIVLKHRAGRFNTLVLYGSMRRSFATEQEAIDLLTGKRKA